MEASFSRLSMLFFTLTVALLVSAQLASSASLWPKKISLRSNITPDNRTLCPEDSNPPSNRVNTTDRLAKLRAEMDVENVDAYLVFMTDEHGSSGGEDGARIKYISGFSGSNGWVAVTKQQAALWTDGRYYLQADQQLDCNWIMMKDGEPGYPSTPDWLKSVLAANSKVGAFPNYVATETWQSYETQLATANIAMVGVSDDLVDRIWTTRPPAVNIQLMVHDISFAGETWESKISRVREKMAAVPADGLVVSVLEQVAWLFNLRGDQMSNPLFYAYAVVFRNESRIYLRNYTVLISPRDIQEHLRINENGECLQPNDINCIMIHDYNAIYDNLEILSKSYKLWIDPSANYAVYNSSGDLRTVSASPIELMKSIKNAVEREKMTDCIMRDSAAVVEFASFLEHQVKTGNYSWTEITASDWIDNLRRQYPNNRGLSFDTISGFGPNGAVIHYRATPETVLRIDNTSLYLLDSGGQYLDGTTDITRTFHYGTPTNKMKEAYTRVLMGHIDLATVVWPEGIYGRELDAIARVPLWNKGWDYNHGTGHGIGYFLSVHEGPGRINLGYDPDHTPLYEGMIFSDEPGYYEDNEFGIRLEILVMVNKTETENQFGGRKYVTFKPLTLVPYEPHLIDYSMLSRPQIDWLNEYNKECLEKTGAYVRDVRQNQDAYDWIVDRTEFINYNKPLTTSSAGPTASALTHSTTVIAGMLIALAMNLVG